MNEDSLAARIFHRTIDVDLRSLASLIKEMEAFGESAGIPKEIMMQLSLVLEEIITNATKYGYPGARRGCVEITATLFPGLIRLEIGDDGDSFDPATAPGPDLHSALDARSIGGLGLHLVRKLMDSFDYQRKNGRNLVTVTKRF